MAGVGWWGLWPDAKVGSGSGTGSQMGKEGGAASRQRWSKGVRSVGANLRRSKAKAKAKHYNSRSKFWSSTLKQDEDRLVGGWVGRSVTQAWVRFGFPQDQQQHLIWIISARCRCPAEHRLIGWLVAACMLCLGLSNGTARLYHKIYWGSRKTITLPDSQSAGWLASPALITHQSLGIHPDPACPTSWWIQYSLQPATLLYLLKCNWAIYSSLLYLISGFSHLPPSKYRHLAILSYTYQLVKKTSQLGANREKPHTTIRPNPTYIWACTELLTLAALSSLEYAQDNAATLSKKLDKARSYLTSHE